MSKQVAEIIYSSDQKFVKPSVSDYFIYVSNLTFVLHLGNRLKNKQKQLREVVPSPRDRSTDLILQRLPQQMYETTDVIAEVFLVKDLFDDLLTYSDNVVLLVIAANVL